MKRSSGRQQNQRMVETTGKTVEKALEKALGELGASVEQVDIEILEAGQKGMLGIFGAKDAKIRVQRKSDGAPDDEVRAVPCAAHVPASRKTGTMA